MEQDQGISDGAPCGTGSRPSGQAASRLDAAALRSLASIDSGVYRAGFYGILNAQGDFWTPLAFDSEAKAWQHVRDFWGSNHESALYCLNRFRVVPVRVQLFELSASAIEAGTGETAHDAIEKGSHHDING